jgi:hypothetical protein
LHFITKCFVFPTFSFLLVLLGSLFLFLLLFGFVLGLLLFLSLVVLGLLGFVSVIVAVTVSVGVDGLTDFHGRVLKFLKRLGDLVSILRDNGLVEGRDVTSDLLLNAIGKSSGVFSELLLSVVNVLVSLVLEVNDSLLGFIVGLGVLGLINHAVNVGIGETTGRTDSDVLGLTGGFVLGGDVHDTVGINVESNLNLGVSSGSHGDTGEIEITELLVVLGELTLSLENRDSDLGLVIGSGGENLRFLGGNGRVSVDESGEDSSHSLNTERKGSDIEEEDILNISSEDGSLDGGTDSDGLIGVNTSVGGLSEEVLDDLSDLGDSGRSSNHEYFINLILGETGVLEAGFEGLDGSLNELLGESFELSSGEGSVEMLGARVIESEIGDVNGGLGSGGEFTLGLLSSLTDSLDGSLVGLNINSTLGLEFSLEEILEFDIEIFASKSGISVGGLHFEDTSGNLEDGDIESTTTEIVNSDDLTVSLVLAEGEGSGGGLVDDTLNIEVSDLTGILGSLSLGIVEVSGDSHDGLLDSGTDVRLSGLLHLGEDEGTDLRRRVLLSSSFNPGISVGGSDDLVRQVLHIGLSLSILKSASNKSLSSVKSVFGVLYGLDKSVYNIKINIIN